MSEDGLSRFKDRLKVVRITGDKPELLFDLRYIIWITPIDAAVVWAIPEGDQYILRLTSDSYKKVLFKWSAEEQKFSVEGQDSPYWEVLYYGPGVAAGE